jgi:hypothetical protein
MTKEKTLKMLEELCDRQRRVDDFERYLREKNLRIKNPFEVAKELVRERAKRIREIPGGEL